MRLRRGPEFFDEWERFAFRFTCESCVHFMAEPGPTCAHGWPHEEHREPYYRVEERQEVVFCKEFELV